MEEQDIRDPEAIDCWNCGEMVKECELLEDGECPYCMAIIKDGE